MTEPGETAARPSPINPLREDRALFDMYMHALDGALREPEVRSAFDEFGISYVDAIAQDAANTGSSKRIHDSAEDTLDMFRWIRLRATIIAVLVTIIGVATWPAWHPMLTLAEAGGSLLAATRSTMEP